MTIHRYRVTGMSCGHCVQAVTDEVGKVASVESVDVDLASGIVTVTSEEPLDDSRVAEAVREAGYELSQ